MPGFAPKVSSLVSTFAMPLLTVLVPAGHRAVIFSRGGGIKLNTVKTEGLNFVVPYWQWPHLFDVRITPQKITTNTPTKGTPVTISLLKF